ncbi:hypothetical protein MPS_5181 [Mycobacterium pseudoshottsii JCM 15466]|nr:hypothetical protein MPS_5181 [Mycobacterium pseudoshottsii JCM 15466]
MLSVRHGRAGWRVDGAVRPRDGGASGLVKPQMGRRDRDSIESFRMRRR